MNIKYWTKTELVSERKEARLVQMMEVLTKSIDSKN